MDHAELIELEHQAWKALTTGGATATAFYERVLADDVLMLLPRGLVLDDRATVIDSMGGEPWTSFSLADERVIELSDDTAVVAYRASAHRGAVEYRALFNSTYVREPEGWRLRLHQQTPL
ncbi:MAG TPA: nuclear transport factor 2 family protein [Acidimicrobiales bacterium]|nr:nuclear transport factor 2 family protein [Acidimicrobiales bacterium]